jgi:serine/threonine protein kinase
MYGDELQGYRFDKEIGKGAFSKVYLATKKDTGERYAIKRIDKSFVNDKRYKKYLNNEIFILNNIKHENVIKYE